MTFYVRILFKYKIVIVIIIKLCIPIPKCLKTHTDIAKANLDQSTTINNWNQSNHTLNYSTTKN